MDISTAPRHLPSRPRAGQSIDKAEAPVEISVNDVVYIRRDQAEQAPGLGLNGAFKIGGTALVGGACGAIPLVGAFSNILAADDSSQAARLIGLGGAALNVAASVALAATGNPAWMAVPAAAGAMAWGLNTSDTLAGKR